MTKKAKIQQERNEAADKLRAMLKPGDTVYTVLRHVSSNGMFRVIDLLVPCEVSRTIMVTGKPKLGDNAYYRNPERFFSGFISAIDGDMITVKESYGNNPLTFTFKRAELLKITRDTKVPGICSIGWRAADAMGRKWHDKSGIAIGGCGMDMGFSLVYDLGRTLWPNGTPKAHSTRNGEPDRDGGYALKHQWI